MSRAATIGKCLLVAALGLVVSAVFVTWSPWPIYANTLSALACVVLLGVPELLLLRHYPRASSALRLDAIPFPYAALGFGAGVLVFGLR